MTEQWEVLDGAGNPTGRVVTRGKNALKAGEYHLVVHIWIVSSDGEFLIQRRADEKKLMPGEWAATGGSALAGEDSFTAAKRELLEELGINASAERLQKLTRMKRRNSMLDLWMVVNDRPAETLALQKSEVAEARWVKKETLCAMIRDGKFHNYGDAYFETVFSLIDEHRRATV